ncbi:DUF1998 domain-containing protein [Actinoplanes sichuanensis]|uniref:DrmB family protein n=2 Tax=Actinoplanes sichuanensis TaxID=512349 RepID=A0ABW4AS13_9ACTN|nr:DUF1998 domain-containing protein [Actinoplanes sichuanensis]
MPGRSRTPRAGRSAAGPAPKPIGSARRAQMITTYGVGSMIAIDDASWIVAGLEDWRPNTEQQVHEPRIQRALGVDYLYLPPAESAYFTAGLRRFPEFYSCQGSGNCNLLQPYWKFRASDSKCPCGEGTLIPSRFVVACDDGHLNDFPYRAWIHRGAKSGPCDQDMRMITTGRTASLRSIQLVCGCGAKGSMEGAFRRSELRQLGIKCYGGRPWLRGAAKVTGCERLPRTLQRGSSAAWFGIVRSSLAIPPWSTGLQRIIESRFEMWRDEDDATIERQAIKAKLVKGSVTVQHIIDAVRRREALEKGNPVPDQDLDLSLKREEYEQLCSPTVEEQTDEKPDFECRPAEAVPVPQLDQVMLVTRLREVRVLQSFTRVEPPGPADAESRRGELSVGEMDWLPAMEVVGEGVFLRLSERRLTEWEERPEVRKRAAGIIGNHQRLLDRRAEAAGKTAPVSPVTARSIMIHTLAHLLVNEWSLDSGYPASAMRERLYTSPEMAGILIYTATSDSAGSLGGIVRQGEPERLKHTLAAALRRAEWCSTDPLCMEADAAGSDSLNLAACHACSLLPETSCEHNNTLLDRGLVLGWPAEPELGFFS